jgi:acid phosphatase
MPSDGFTGCSSGNYARKHNGWVDFSNVAATSNLRFTAFPTDFATLPTFSYVVPNLCNDMHDCSISTGDTWVRTHLDAYAQWARTHNSLLIVTFDEDSGTSTNKIFTVIVGQHVKTGTFSESVNHYTILRTVEDAYGLPAIGAAASATPILDIWQ